MRNCLNLVSAYSLDMLNPAYTAYLHHVETQYFASLQQKNRFRPFLNANWRKFKQFLRHFFCFYKRSLYFNNHICFSKGFSI